MTLIHLKEHEFVTLTTYAYNTLKEEGSQSEAVKLLEEALKVAARHSILDLACVSTAVPLSDLEPEIKKAMEMAVRAQEKGG